MSTPEDKIQPDIYPEEKRLSQRFFIPGATVSYRKERWLGQKRDFDEEFCPLQNISRGGLSFLCRQHIKPGTELSLQLSIPGERAPLNQLGEVRWSTAADNKNFPYRVGVQFNAYGNKKGQNYPGNLVKIISLEHKFADRKQTETVDETECDEYKVESS